MVLAYFDRNKISKKQNFDFGTKEVLKEIRNKRSSEKNEFSLYTLMWKSPQSTSGWLGTIGNVSFFAPTPFAQVPQPVVGTIFFDENNYF